MRALDVVWGGSLLCAGLLLGTPPVARAGLAERARSSERATAADRALQGGVLTLRSPGSLMIRVAASDFVMGSTALEILDAVASCSREPLGYRCNDQTFADEQPRRKLHQRSFWLDRTEVTAEDYDRCAERGVCAPRSLEGGAKRFAAKTLPATLVSARDAETYCEARGARLPHETEFERAARGTEGRRYPWGNVYGKRLANHGRLGVTTSDWTDGYAELAPVGSFPSGRTPDGFLDLAGNAAEWTADTYSERYGEPPNPGWGGARTLRGGSYDSGAGWLRGAARSALPPDERRPQVGFRCARALDEDAPDGPEPSTDGAQASH